MIPADLRDVCGHSPPQLENCLFCKMTEYMEEQRRTIARQAQLISALRADFDHYLKGKEMKIEDKPAFLTAHVDRQRGGV